MYTQGEKLAVETNLRSYGYTVFSVEYIFLSYFVVFKTFSMIQVKNLKVGRVGGTCAVF
jgi:hypothetical protein